MGHLTLPDSGSIYLDTSGFIYSVEGVEPYYSLLEPMWRQAQAGQFVIIWSDITVLETLVVPLRQGNTLFKGAPSQPLSHRPSFISSVDSG